MIFEYKKVALILVLSFLAVEGDLNAHDHNHQSDHHWKQDALSAFDHYFHEYHHQHPIEQPNCGQICPKSIPRFKLDTGHTYTIDLDGQILINVKEGQSVDLKSKVDVTYLSPCEFTLKLRDSQVSGVPNSQELSQELNASPILRFGAFDGKILGVCPTAEEKLWTLNIKKSILSSIQITSKDLTSTQTVEEVDFSGHCTTIYRPLSDTSDLSNILIEKTKNLNKCHLRRKNIAGFKSKSLTLLTEFLRENMPLLKSTQKCILEIKGGHLTSVKCTEEQRLAFQEDSITITSLNLQFNSKAPATNLPSGPIPQNAETLLMSRDDESSAPSNEAEVLNLLKVMCNQVSGETLAPQVTQSFHSLMRALRTLPEAGTRTLDKVVKSGELCQNPKLRDLFIGASAFAASDPSIQTLISAYNNKELNEAQITILLGIAALKTRPSEKTIEQLVTLIEPKDSGRRLMIGVSLMVRNYCKKSENCLEVPAVKKTITALLSRLQGTDKLEKITAIKALDNIRPKTDETAKNTLISLAQDSAEDIGVRIAAIQALKRVADDNVRQKLIEILSKDNEPTEVRILAYRTVVLSGATVQQLATIQSETDPQIQNYIRTHIKNLKKSSENRRKLLPEGAPEFEEPRNTGIGVTRNVECNYKDISLELDVIHPKGSVVPSLYQFGVWFPVAGKDYQLLEIQVRHEGLSQHFQKLISKGIGGPEILMQLSEELLELLAHIKDPSHKHSIVLQLSVRMSGNNLIFLDTFEDLHRAIVFIKEKMKEMYNTDKIDMARALPILDSQVEVPTIIGFPMILHLNETIVSSWTADHTWSEAGGQKKRAMRSNRAFYDEVSAGLNIKVRNYRPGFEYHVRAEFTPTMDAQFEKIDGRIMKAKINLPKERKSLMKLTQSTHLIDANGVPKPSNEIAKRFRRANPDDSTKCRQLFGMNICRTRNWPDNSPIPNMEYYMTKEDPELDFIELTMEKPAATATRDLQVWSAKVDAGKREYTAQFELKNPKEGTKSANLKMVSPRRTITAETTLFNSADGNVSRMEFDLKLPNVLDVNSKYSVEQKGEEKNVDLVIEYQCPSNERKETIKWSRKSSFNYKREKKTKQINVMFLGEFKSTQFPDYNSKVSYTTSFKPYQTSKSDLKVEWGQQMKDRIRLIHSSKMDVIELRPFQMTSENAMIIEATPFDVNYDLKLNSDISMLKSKPKLISLDLVGKDVEGRDRNIKGSLKYERTEQPVQQTINASLKYPNREMTYFSEVKQIKDLEFEGKMLYSPEKGKVVTIVHKESVTNPTKEFHLSSEAEISYSFKPDKVKVKTQVGYESADKFEYKHTYERDGQKVSEWEIDYDKKTNGLEMEMESKTRDRKAEIKIDNIKDPRLVQWGMKVGPKSYKFSAVRVPKESVELKLDSSENSRLKEFKAKISRKDRSTLRVVTDKNTEINGFIDIKEAKTHLDFKCPEHGLDHIGEITYNKKDRKLMWESKTNKNGQPWITLVSEFSPKDRSYIILKKLKGSEPASSFEYFYERGVYGATLETKRWSAILEGERRNDKNFGKLGFVDKVDNYEHKSHFNYSNGILTVKSISDKEKQTFTKLDAIIGRKIISNVSLITPKVNAQLTVNPLGEKKTMVIKLVSDKYDHDSNVEWVPRKYLKVDALSHRKIAPEKRIKVDAYLTRQDESTFRMTAPQLDVDIRRVKTPKPRYIFNTTINGYNEVQEFDSNPSMTPIQNLMVALRKYFQSYTSDN